MIKVNGTIEGNDKYKKVFDRYLASPLFSDRCKELKKSIKEQEERERKEKEIKSKELKLF